MWKETRSFDVDAGYSCTAQVTSESFRYPFQLARAAISILQALQVRLRASLALHASRIRRRPHVPTPPRIIPRDWLPVIHPRPLARDFGSGTGPRLTARWVHEGARPL